MTEAGSRLRSLARTEKLRDFNPAEKSTDNPSVDVTKETTTRRTPLQIITVRPVTPTEGVTHLERYRCRLLNLDRAPMIAMPSAADYDGLVLRSWALSQ